MQTALMTNRRPLIGITGDIDDDTGLCTVEREYGEAIWHAGGIPVVIGPVSASRAYAAAALSRIDGLILSGGGDIDPALYGEKKRALLFDVHPARDAFEKELVMQAHAADLPVLGVCRGMQMMNVALGGTLVQDIASQDASLQDVFLRQGAVPQRASAPSPNTFDRRASCTASSERAAVRADIRAHKQEKPYAKPAHEVRLVEKTLVRRLCHTQEATCENGGAGHAFVNSMHHQAVAKPAPGFVVSASCGNVVEAIEDPGKTFFLGIQWHPEYLEEGAALFEGFCEAARARRQARENDTQDPR